MDGAAKPDSSWELRQPVSDPGSPNSYSTPGAQDDWRLAMTYCIAQAIMDIAGPLFWAALVLAFVTGALGIDLFR
jgi:hypothetical protein